MPTSESFHFTFINVFSFCLIKMLLGLIDFWRTITDCNTYTTKVMSDLHVFGDIKCCYFVVTMLSSFLSKRVIVLHKGLLIMVIGSIGHDVSELLHNSSMLGSMWDMGAPASQPLPAPWLGWEKPALRGTQDSDCHRCAVFQRGKMALWWFNVLHSCDREGKRGWRTGSRERACCPWEGKVSLTSFYQQKDSIRLNEP